LNHKAVGHYNTTNKILAGDTVIASNNQRFWPIELTNIVLQQMLSGYIF